MKASHSLKMEPTAQFLNALVYEIHLQLKYASSCVARCALRWQLAQNGKAKKNVGFLLGRTIAVVSNSLSPREGLACKMGEQRRKFS